jgi:hypothetical protein
LRWQELPRDFLPIPFRLPASVALPPLESEKPTASPQRSPEKHRLTTDQMAFVAGRHVALA